MRQYLDDILVWTIILIVLVPILLALFKRSRVFVFIFGALLVLSSLPIMIAVGLSNDFSGSKSGVDVGVIAGIISALLGILIMIFSKKLSKKK